MKDEVLAYITHEHNGQRQRLVFTHRNYPEAGGQAPAGTAGRVFEYGWTDLRAGLELSGAQDSWLHLI